MVLTGATQWYLAGGRHGIEGEDGFTQMSATLVMTATILFPDGDSQLDNLYVFSPTC